MSDESCRAAFEAWMAQYVPKPHMNRTECGEYIMYYVYQQWQAWQAASEHAKKTMCNRS